jgi:hypothetical protein
MTEDTRITRARELLSESKSVDAGTRAYSGARWHGRLEVAVEELLAWIDEQRQGDADGEAMDRYRAAMGQVGRP